MKIAEVFSLCLPGLDLETMNHILWEHTAYPVCSEEYLIGQLRDFAQEHPDGYCQGSCV
jgi:hypothetical protein